MSARVAHIALGAAAREIRRDLRHGARWADAHLVGEGNGRATVLVDSSIGFDEKRHPARGKSARAATTIFVEVA